MMEATSRHQSALLLLFMPFYFFFLCERSRYFSVAKRWENLNTKTIRPTKHIYFVYTIIYYYYYEWIYLIRFLYSLIHFRYGWGHLNNSVATDEDFSLLTTRHTYTKNYRPSQSAPNIFGEDTSLFAHLRQIIAPTFITDACTQSQKITPFSHLWLSHIYGFQT